MIHDNPRIAEAVRVYHGTVNPAQGKLPKGSLFINISTGKVYIDDGTSLSEIATSASTDTTAETKAAAAVGTLFLGSGDSVPSGKGATKGQLFIRTGATSPGLYMCTVGGESTSTWTAVAAAT